MTLRIAMRLVPVALLAASAPAVLALGDDAAKAPAPAAAAPSTDLKPPYAAVVLKEDARVRTFSLGDGMLKRVAVAPADFPERTEDDSAS